MALPRLPVFSQIKESNYVWPKWFNSNILVSGALLAEWTQRHTFKTWRYIFAFHWDFKPQKTVWKQPIDILLCLILHTVSWLESVTSSGLFCLSLGNKLITPNVKWLLKALLLTGFSGWMIMKTSKLCFMLQHLFFCIVMLYVGNYCTGLQWQFWCLLGTKHILGPLNVFFMFTWFIHHLLRRQRIQLSCWPMRVREKLTRDAWMRWVHDESYKICKIIHET